MISQLGKQIQRDTRVCPAVPETGADHKARVLRIHWKESKGEGACCGEIISGPYQEPIGSHRVNHQICDTAHIDPVADRQALQLWNNGRGASHASLAAEVLNQVIAIESGSVAPIFQVLQT